MLHYVLQYPNTQRYIALFPSDQPEKFEDQKEKLVLPSLIPARGKEKRALKRLADDVSGLKRLEMLLDVRQRMESGELSATPETMDKTPRGRRVPDVASAKLPKSKRVEVNPVAAQTGDAGDFFDDEVEDEEDDHS